MSPVAIEIEWPNDAKAGTVRTLHLTLRHDRSDVSGCEVRSNSSNTVREPMKSDIVPRIDDDEDIAAETRKANEIR